MATVLISEMNPVPNKYIPTLENYPYKPKNIIPQKGDYMVATFHHWNALVQAGYKVNGSADDTPNEFDEVILITEHGVTSTPSWGGTGVTEGRAIHCHSPGHWTLGLTPFDIEPQSQVEVKPARKFCTVK